jgi:hypothetical protein
MRSAAVHRVTIALGVMCCVFGFVNLGEGADRKGIGALSTGVVILLISWYVGRMRSGGWTTTSLQLQAMFFFAGCTIIGLAFLVLTIAGVLKDPMVGVFGGVGAILGIYVLVKGARVMKASGGEDGER